MIKPLLGTLADEHRLQAIVDASLDAVVQMNAQGCINGWSQHAADIFGWTHEEAMWQPLHALIIPQHYRAAHLAGLQRFLSTGVKSILNKRVEVEALHKDGHAFPIELTITSIVDASGTTDFIAFVRDITERRQVEANQAIAAIAFEGEDGIAITDHDGRTIRVNQSFIRMTGYSEDEVLHQDPLFLHDLAASSEPSQRLWATARAHKFWQGELQGQRKSGELFAQWTRITAVLDRHEQITHFVINLTDITDQKKSQATIHQLAFSDPLTGLPNRLLLMERLSHKLTTLNRHPSTAALLFIDLDHFKKLNDTKGHDKGDLLLQQVAKRLLLCVRDGDTVARFGGDEFVVILVGLAEDLVAAATQTEMVGQKIMAALSRTFHLGNIEHHITCSIGATLFNGLDTSLDNLLKQADLAMYRSKDAGRNTMHFFDPSMQEVVTKRAELEDALREALLHSEFELFYQAQVNSFGRVQGAEALIRWFHPLRGMIAPTEFIPLAENTGLILPIGEWVMESACRQLVKWSAHPHMTQLTLSVNVSALQFQQKNFVSQVCRLLETTRCNPNRLKLELTESLMASNVDDLIEKMNTLQQLGITFALDDFGTGFSSLSFLKRLPLDQLKIDQSFVKNISANTNDAAIANMVIALAQSIHLSVIAEGVETTKQRDFLQALGCQSFQGYLYSRPIPLADFEKYCSQNI